MQYTVISRGDPPVLSPSILLRFTQDKFIEVPGRPLHFHEDDVF